MRLYKTCVVDNFSHVGKKAQETGSDNKKRSRLVERFFPQVFEKYLVNILVPVIESELTVFEVKIKG